MWESMLEYMRENPLGSIGIGLIIYFIVAYSIAVIYREFVYKKGKRWPILEDLVAFDEEDKPSFWRTREWLKQRKHE